MFKTGDIVDGKYVVDGICSETGGMGTLLFVHPIEGSHSERVVLKYCKETEEEFIKRFRREVRLLKEFQGNRRVVKLVDSNLECEPPYFVMKYYPGGDLEGISPQLKADRALQETVFNQMIDCINELHARGTFHRDIKPQNFLVDDDAVVVSDFGLSAELNSRTAFTRNSSLWGTQGYLPPEFHQPGGFKNPDAASDIFMLGKTFYVLLSGRDPLYLVPDGIDPPLFAVIERCCTMSKEGRYQTLSALKQSLKAAYDILLERVVGPETAAQVLRSILDRLNAQQQYQTQEIIDFVERLAMLESRDRIKICFEVPAALFNVLAQPPFEAHLGRFLSVYREMVEDGAYGWSYAETIADNMKLLFDSAHVTHADKASALRIAMQAAVLQNRYAAMDTCQSMITSVVDEGLGLRVRDIILEFPQTFVVNIDPAACGTVAVRTALHDLQSQTGNGE